MDTNDLTEKAYDILTLAESINHLITVLIGASSSRYRQEDDFLHGVIKLIEEIQEAPEEFMDDWDLYAEIDLPALTSGLAKLRNYPVTFMNYISSGSSGSYPGLFSDDP